MRSNFHPRRTALAILISAIGSPATTWAAPADLVQYPAGTAYKAPIPNVILSVDTSGSMAYCDVDGAATSAKNCGTATDRITYVKNGLKTLLIDSAKYDGQFRLAWQSFACNGIPSNSGSCGNKNAMAKFTGTHRTNFGTWVNALTATGSTPSPVLAWNAGKYLQTTGASSPWNATPGTADDAPLACRRAYHIFLTDGGWNFKFSDAGLTGTSFESDMKLGTKDSTDNNPPSDPTNNVAVSNYDGKAIAALPTPAPASSTHPASPYGVKAYSVTAPSDATQDQTKIYRDNYGTRVVNISSGNIGTKSKPKYTHTYYAYPTLADVAFYFWSTDLQPSIANEVIPKIRKKDTETFTSGSNSITFAEYWNPKNDSAEWQHLTQYTIGYGSTAGTLGKIGGGSSSTYNGKACSNYTGTNKTTCENSSTSPQWAGGVFGMYGAGFTDLAAGKTKWDDVTSSNADSDYDDFRPQEMWHMAINSRGKFYPVSGGDLTSVFADIFDDIVVDTTAPISGFTSASGSVSRVGTESYQTSYIAADDPNSNDNRWYGYVTSDTISTAGAATPNTAWGTNTSTGKNKTTADKLDEITNLDNRLILSYDILKTTAQKGISFKWANLTNSTTGASSRMWLNKGTVGTGTTAAIAASIAGDSKGEDRLKFIRGDRSKEASQAGGTFRNRKNRQGDIVNSAIWYVGPPASGYTMASYKTFASSYRARHPMLYVGGNDGMLHGFSAYDGTEKIAYVPHGVVQNLAKFTDPAYSHQYYVDGSPMSGDINIGTSESPDWRTYLVGTLGAGGRGYFVLDITKPGSANGKTGVANDFVETNAANLVVMDKTAAPAKDAAPPGIPADPNANADIGHIFGSPVVAESNQQRTMQITRTNDNRWALIMGNGYNSANERPALLIQYLDGSKELKTISTRADACPAGAAKGNGLSTPQFLDVNSDGIPDFVYAGDLCGNMWKFDISNASGDVSTDGVADADHWGVSFNGSPLFTATYTASGSSSRQPITAPPSLRPNREVGGLMVAFGTGQNLTEADRSDTSTQTVYSVLDNTRYQIEATGTNKGKVKVKTSEPTPATVGGRSDLVSQSVDGGTGTGTAGTGNSAGRSFWKLDTQEVTYTCADDATSCTVKKGWYMDLPVAGERVTTSFDFYDGSNILEIISEKPASGSATASGEEVCAPQPQAAKPFRTLINIASGTAATPPIMDVNGDGAYTAADNIGGSSSGSPAARSTASSKELRFATKSQQIRKGNDGKEDKLAKLPELLLRPNWRQLK